MKATCTPNAYIRTAARKVFKSSDKPRVCTNCGYSKHVEIAHLHAISEFPKSTKISIVNDISNLMALCRNCHWELDFGDLSVEDITLVNN